MNTTTHPVAPEDIMAFLDAELAADKAQSVSSHLEGCAECREIKDAFRSLSLSLSNWSIPVEPPLQEPRVQAATGGRLDSRTLSGFAFRRNSRWSLRKWIVGLSASAAVVLLLLAAAIPNLLRSPTERSRQDIAEAERLPQGEHFLAPFQDHFTAPRLPGNLGALGKLSVGEQIAPMIARTVSLSIVATDFIASRASLDAILLRHHGYAANLAVHTEQNAARSLQASLRVPAPELSAALAELKSLGQVENETQNGEEVTQQHADLVARLKNSRETEARLQDILHNRTGKISDILAVEQEIARVRGEIEQMEAERKTLEHRVDFATVDLKLSEEYKAQLGSPTPSISTRFHNAMITGFQSALETLVGVVLFFAEYSPTLLAWLVVLFPPAWLVWRRWRRSYVLASSPLR